LGAIAVANEKMEIIRNLSYTNIGVVGGSISGSIPEDETVTENTGHYNVHTTVLYKDDPLDGSGYSDSVWFEDYKEVTLEVSWTGASGNTEQVETVSRFVPQGLEVKNINDGILSINVFSDQPGGTGIPSSTVHVVNTATGLDTEVDTDNTGNITLMGDKIKNSIQKYQITVSKSGYETVNTMAPYPTSSYNPIDVHASVVLGSINMANIVQNKLAKLKVSTIDYLGNAIQNIPFHLTGGRKLGTQAASPFTPIYNIDSDYSTGSNGEKDFGSVSPGQFTFTLSPSVTDYAVIDMTPTSPFTLFSDNDLNFKISLAAKNATSLLVRVNSDVSGNTAPVTTAQVELKNSSGYDVTQTVSASGTTFFPNSADTFQPGTYDLKITADGFDENDSQVQINSNELKIETLTLTPS
jgi:hypothetical protein